MASKRVQLTITAQRFFDDAQNKREAVRVWSLPWKLPYYIESWDSQNEQAKVWVKVPKVPAGGSVDLYIYYGNSGAESESDGEAVFEFFDDFDTADYTVIRGSSSQVSVSDGWLRIDATSGVDSTYNDIIVELNKQASISGDFIVESKVTIDTKEAYAVMLETNGQGYSGQWYGDIGDMGYIMKWDGWSSKSVLADDTHYSAPTGSTQVLRWDRVGSELRLWDTDLSQVILTASSSTYTSFSKVAIRVYDGGVWQTDWVRVRKYAEQEPNISVGSEESSDVSGWLYRRKITITNPNSYDLEHFQVAIDLDSSNFDFSKANSDGSDIRVTYGEGRYELPYYIDTWDTATPQAIIWVGIDSETKFYIELNPANTTDDSDASVMNLDEATNYSLNKFEKYT